MNSHNVVVIAGPTASGKSDLALSLAQEKNGVIINADSLQIYDALPILTAQPTTNEKQTVPHRLYAVLTPEQKISAASWRDRALTEIAAAQDAGQLPIICGGTGFYIKALVEGLSPIPEVPDNFRRQAAALHSDMGAVAFHAFLTEKDPAIAARLKPQDTQRVIRAYEVFLATGKPLSHWQSLPVVPPPAHLSFETIAVIPPREELYARCDARFLKMLEMGALDEVRDYQGPDSKALGYAELKAHLQGEMTLDDAIAQAQQQTRQYAKRQTTWCRHQINTEIIVENSSLSNIIHLT